MSVSKTEAAVRSRDKTETRRLDALTAAALTFDALGRRRADRRAVDRALAEWGPLELAREVRSGERDHHGALP